VIETNRNYMMIVPLFYFLIDSIFSFFLLFDALFFILSFYFIVYPIKNK